MSDTAAPAPVRPDFRERTLALWTAAPERVLGAGAAVLLFAAYALVFLVTGAANPAGAAVRALYNTVPAALLAVPTYAIIRAKLVETALARQAAGNLGLSLAFALAWYLGIQVGYGLQDGWLTTGLTPRSFSGIAFTWQMFQGVTLYAAIAAYAYAVAFWQRARRLEAERDEARRSPVAAKPQRPARLLLRQDREFVPVDAGDIVRISGAGDKTEVVTRTGRITTTTTMAELEDAMPDGFLRVHRSHLVALSAVLHAEPAGNGRLTLHLPGGDSVTASRAGAKAFREAAL